MTTELLKAIHKEVNNAIVLNLDVNRHGLYFSKDRNVFYVTSNVLGAKGRICDLSELIDTTMSIKGLNYAGCIIATVKASESL